MSPFTEGTGKASPRRLKVLLVDDDQMIHKTLELFLANTNFSLVSSMNAKDAMTMVFSENPEIIITDAMMPGESGFSLIARLKSRPETSSIPIILWTGLEELNGEVRDASGKADFTISKPFRRSEIMASLEQARKLIKSDDTIEDVTLTF